MLLAVDGLTPGPSDDASDTLLLAAEAAAREALAGRPAGGVPHVGARGGGGRARAAAPAAWPRARPGEEWPHGAASGEASRPFGAKPQRTRNSLEALLRRA